MTQRQNKRGPRGRTPKPAAAWTGLTVMGVGLGIAAPVLVTPGFAQQQELRGQTVFERDRPEFDAKGIDAGGFVLFPTLSVTATYEDNIFADEDDEESDTIIRTRPGIQARSKWSRHELRAGADFRANSFLDNSEQDTAEYGADASLLLDISRRANLRVGAAFDRLTVDRADPEEAGREDPEELDQLRGNVVASYRFNRLGIAVEAKASDISFVDELDEDSDRQEYEIAPKVSYEFSPALSGFVEPFYRVRDFDNDRDAGGIDRDSDVRGAFVGVSYDLTEILYGDTSIGYFDTEFADDRFDNETGVSVRSRTTWNITPLTTLKGTVSRENLITNEPNSSSRTRFLVGAEAQHELRRNVLVGAKASFFQDDFTDDDREDDNLTFEATADYLVNRYASIAASWDITDRDSSQDGTSFTRNRFLIGIRTKF
ncbi:MAG: outer membrane beta-barrel protein [Pseudomonadota bacterium]